MGRNSPNFGLGVLQNARAHRSSPSGALRARAGRGDAPGGGACMTMGGACRAGADRGRGVWSCGRDLQRCGRGYQSWGRSGRAVRVCGRVCGRGHQGCGRGLPAGGGAGRGVAPEVRAVHVPMAARGPPRPPRRRPPGPGPGPHPGPAPGPAAPKEAAPQVSPFRRVSGLAPRPLPRRSARSASARPQGSPCGCGKFLINPRCSRGCGSQVFPVNLSAEPGVAVIVGPRYSR